MDYQTKEEIMEIIKDYDYKRLMDTFNYVCNCKINLINLIEKNKELKPSNYEEYVEYFRRIEDCIYKKLFEEKKNEK